MEQCEGTCMLPHLSTLPPFLYSPNNVIMTPAIYTYTFHKPYIVSTHIHTRKVDTYTYIDTYITLVTHSTVDTNMSSPPTYHYHHHHHHHHHHHTVPHSTLSIETPHKGYLTERPKTLYTEVTGNSTGPHYSLLPPQG